MIEVLGIVASLLGIIAFFAVGPKDLLANLKGWFVEPITSINKHKNKLDIRTLFDLLKVEDIRQENIFTKKTLKKDSFDADVLSYEYKFTEELQKIKDDEIKSKLDYAQKNGITLDNNASFALRRIDVSRPEGKDGKRHNVYKLMMERTDYHSFVFPNLCLDKLYYNEATQENHSLRDRLSLEQELLSISNLTDLPQCQFKIGTGTLLVTKDGFLICSVRSKNQLVAGKQDKNEITVHLSAAEGMYRSVNNPSSGDVDTNGKPSPFITSSRSIIDELNLREEDFNAEDIECLGYFMDLKRAQPFFLFYLKVNLSVDDFFAIYSNTSTDIHENEAIFALPKNFDNLKGLFTGKRISDVGAKYPKIYDDFFSVRSSYKIRIASNHAKAGFATYAFKDLGPITRDLL
ncbi:MAG: hypothetical protein ACTJH9_13575 [Pseudoalteromonas sp.]|uniref:hypothetical protein n=1 Tax=unclassified Pseudoalteromonas TaxID=194690 RepID=UPI003F9A7D0F